MLAEMLYFDSSAISITLQIKIKNQLKLFQISQFQHFKIIVKVNFKET